MSADNPLDDIHRASEDDTVRDVPQAPLDLGESAAKTAPTVPRPGIHPMYQSPVGLTRPGTASDDDPPPPTYDISQPPAGAPSGIATNRPPVDWTVDDGNTSGKQKGVPFEVSDLPWNWGAFLVTPAWCVGNGALTIGCAWIALVLLAVIAAGFWSSGFGKPVAGLLILSAAGVGVLAGLRGNTVAWENRRFDDIEQFLDVQRSWSIGGGITAGLSIAIAAVVLGVVSITGRSHPVIEQDPIPAVVYRAPVVAPAQSQPIVTAPPMVTIRNEQFTPSPAPAPANAAPGTPAQTTSTTNPQTSPSTQSTPAAAGAPEYGGPPPPASPQTTPSTPSTDGGQPQAGAPQTPADIQTSQPSYPQQSQSAETAQPTAPSTPSAPTAPAAPSAPDYGGPPPAASQ